MPDGAPPVVDTRLAERLVADVVVPRFPEAAGLPLHVVDGGWDNLVVRVGAELVLRLPIRPEAAVLVRHEARWLAEAAAPLRVPVPVPLLVGGPTAYYPWPWIVTRWIDGILVDDVDPGDRSTLVEGLADALAALHRPAPPGAPPNPFRGVDVAARDDVVRARIAAWDGPADELAAVWQAALDAPRWEGPAVWLHGDPHPRNLLMDGSGLAGLLDFGDITAGDPASDLATAWLCFGPADRARFRARLDASGRYDAHVWTRAAGWAASFATGIAPGTPMERTVRHAVAQLTM